MGAKGVGLWKEKEVPSCKVKSKNLKSDSLDSNPGAVIIHWPVTLAK